MFSKPFRLIGLGFVLLFFAVVFACFQGATPVQAASQLQADTNPTCVTCHENRYYLHDTGNWYCVTEASDRCVNCHGGNAEALTEAEAHTGLIANPFADDGEHCRQCHGDDADALIEQVSALTGFHASTVVEPYVAPEAQSEISLPDEPEAPFWLVPVAIAVFAFWAWLVLRSSRL